jgi:hypothetical protein
MSRWYFLYLDIRFDNPALKTLKNIGDVSKVVLDKNGLYELIFEVKLGKIINKQAVELSW